MRRWFLLALLPLTLAAGPGTAAEPPPDSQACRGQCGATLPRRADNPQSVQTCLMRCQALEGRRNLPSLRPPPPPRANASRGVPPPGTPLPGAATTSRVGAIYLAAPPSPRYGLVAGMDRITAHRLAESQCKGTDGTPCRLGLEFQDRCGAVAQGVTPRGIMLTDDPSTYLVVLSTTGSGPTPADADREALADCRLRHRNAICRVVATRCQP
ncbi:DUF4189 domain-containing protein [Roseomonas sp. GC11]|uniref:DUF4189 domain-containing protein n=1 Tax=Roseomonas sp. GC11 TaxID=2950546 RepID=UPI00210BAC32|nr:DUF4189 domain-containing protein [Roseomonas sp. GC11]MCQ4161097.1 DUF4189 domain-containing protein [Roseomonas sp. GC11]